jgi:AraC-like DNA-binding protein
VVGRLPEAQPDDRIEIVGVPEVPGLEVLRVDAPARLWRWYHDTYTVVVTLDAFRSSWRYRGRVHDAEAASVGLMEPGEVHAEVRKQQPRDVFRVLFFSPALVDAAACEIGTTAPGIHWTASAVVRPDLHANVTAVHRVLEGEATPLERSTRVMNLLHALLRDYGGDRGRVSRPVDSLACIRRACDLLHDRWNEAVRLDDLAAASGIGRFQLVRAFHAVVGLPPHAYQLSLRVTRAMSLIRSGLPLAAVAAETGFADQSHFTRRFAAVVGVSPARFRRSVG